MSSLIPISTFNAWPSAISNATPEAKYAILQFFAAEIANPNTRRTYLRAAEDFFRFYADTRDGSRLDGVTALHVASWLEVMKARGLSVPTIKVRLAAARMLFQALARDQIFRVNPASVVKGPKHSVRRGKTPVLDGEETLRLLNSIDTTTLIGLRDRALIATMAYSFARIAAVSALKVSDVFRQQQRLWLRLSEKGGKTIDVPCHHQLEANLAAWMDAAGLAFHPNRPLFQTFATQGPRKDGGRGLSGRPMTQPLAWAMINNRAKAAGITTAVCNHTFRATGITAYLRNNGTVERAAVIAGHASIRTTQLYDRRPDDVTLDEIERIRFD